MSNTKVIASLRPVDLFCVATFAATQKDPRRYYLRGVLISSNHLVATDGHRLGRIEVDTLLEGEDLIVPNEAIKLLGQTIGARGRADTEANLKIIKSGELYSFEYQGQTGPSVIGFKPIDGTFPDWTRVISSHTGDGPVSARQRFNWDYLASFQKACRQLTGIKSEYPILTLGPDVWDAARVTCSDERFLGVIMPVRL